MCFQILKETISKSVLRKSRTIFLFLLLLTFSIYQHEQSIELSNEESKITSFSEMQQINLNNIFLNSNHILIELLNLVDQQEIELTELQQNLEKQVKLLLDLNLNLNKSDLVIKSLRELISNLKMQIVSKENYIKELSQKIGIVESLLMKSQEEIRRLERLLQRQLRLLMVIKWGIPVAVLVGFLIGVRVK